ncbi:hypothetical protein N7451_003388 [Penicillium sp. IBT 35674x]|nr:hypothetical protein N7451_003388 [Penicillium sp. IBT 35674x]
MACGEEAPAKERLVAEFTSEQGPLNNGFPSRLSGQSRAGLDDKHPTIPIHATDHTRHQPCLFPSESFESDQVLAPQSNH